MERSSVAESWTELDRPRSEFGSCSFDSSSGSKDFIRPTWDLGEQPGREGMKEVGVQPPSFLPGAGGDHSLPGQTPPGQTRGQEGQVLEEPGVPQGG